MYYSRFPKDLFIIVAIRLAAYIVLQLIRLVYLKNLLQFLREAERNFFYII